MAFDGFKMHRDGAYGSGSNSKNGPVNNGDMGSVASRSSKESTGSHKDKIKGEISKLQEEIASVKGDTLQGSIPNKYGSISGSSPLSPKPSRRRILNPTEFTDNTKSSKLNQVQSMDTIDSDVIDDNENTNGSNTGGNDENNDDNSDHVLTPAPSIHGNTSKVAANLHRKRVWDWNNLPRVGSTALTKHQSFNVISIPIDGETKQILYAPFYNENFKPMNIFLSFNMDSKSKDSRVHSKKRLNSFATYIGQYLKSRLYAYQCVPFHQQEPIDRSYASYDASKDYSEIETIISLWYMQGQRSVSQSNSTFFSADVVQHLLQRKTNARHQVSQTTAIYVPQTGATLMTAKPSIGETIDDIDILLLRPYQESRLGWQLAYDEPNLKVADYPLDISPWMLDEGDAKIVLGSQNSKISSSVVNIVNDKSELIQISNENAGKYFLDCMGRRSGGSYSEESVSSTSKSFNQTPGGDVTPINSTSGSGGGSATNGTGRESPNNSVYHESSRRKVANKLGKKTGLSSLFKRRHQTPATPSSGSPSSATAAASAAASASASSSKQEHPTTDAQGNPIENAWLESYFSRYLSNYKKVDLPTQFLLPKEAQDTPKNDSSSASSGKEMPDSRKAYLYSKESLQLRLPFANDSIPALFCPRIWMKLASNKWKNLLREMYRVLVPGGYSLVSVTDIGISNSFTPKTDQHQFPSTQERDRVLDAMTLAAIEKGIDIYPTQHLAQAFREVGFTNLKYSVLSLKTGDCATEMGCLYEIYSEMNFDILFRTYLPDPTNPPKGTDPTTLFRRFVKEHMGKVDDGAGSLRVLYLVAQKPR